MPSINTVLDTIPEEEKRNAVELLHRAFTDLERCFTPIKKSPEVLAMADDFENIAGFFFGTLSMLTVHQLAEMSQGAKMIRNGTGEPLSRDQRFMVILNQYMEHFHSIVEQMKKIPGSPLYVGK